MEVRALFEARNVPLARELAAKDWGAGSNREYGSNRIYNQCLLMLHDGDWQGVLRSAPG